MGLSYDNTPNFVPTASDWRAVDNFIEFRRLVREAPQRTGLYGEVLIDTAHIWPDSGEESWQPLKEVVDEYL
jgi:hypothetical protein